MSRAMKCTRCGVYYDDYYTGRSNFIIDIEKRDPETVFNALMKVDIDIDTGIDGGYIDRETIDLCKECKNEFLAWMQAPQHDHQA